MYDIIIFGGTGFTGKYVVKTVINTWMESSKEARFSYAVAGRSKKKLEELMEQTSATIGVDLKHVPLIVADVDDKDSLLAMAKQGKVIINCVGPYRLFRGREVVQACIAGGAHCIDMSGEQEYLEGVQKDFDGDAKRKRVYIVGSCGFDSIPGEMGTVHLLKNFGGDMNSVEEYSEMSTNAKIHYGTWASIINGIANRKNVPPIRKVLFDLEPKLPTNHRHKLGRRLLPLHYNQVVQGWCLPYSATVAARSQHLLYRLHPEIYRPLQVQAYVKFRTLAAALMAMLSAVLLGVMIFFPFKLGQKLLLKYPKIMSFGRVTHEGPTPEDMEALEFTVTLVGRGWNEKLSNPTDQHIEAPNKVKMVQVKGRNPGYGATCHFLLQSALTILRESDKLPNSGGVYTPAAAFYNTNLIKNLQARGVSFEMVG